MAVVDGTDFKGFSDVPRRAIAKPRSNPFELPGMGRRSVQCGEHDPASGELTVLRQERTTS